MERKIKSFSLIKTPHWPEYDLKVTLKPCFKCNHQCWFCEEYNNNTKTWSKSQCDQVIDKLIQIPEERKRLFFYFYGGEPTLSSNWEYLNEKLVETHRHREIYIQTQTNLSLSEDRLRKFLDGICTNKPSNHTIDICSSYHLNKQTIDEFITKLKICEEYDCLGLCFFSTELPEREQTIREFTELLKVFPEKIKLRFTETAKLATKNVKGYEQYLTDSYLVGDDDGKSLEYRYWLREFPEWRAYFEQGWNFDVDGEVYNFSDVSGKNIHMKFKYMKCECGTKNIVIDHMLNVFHCNDDFYSNINSTKLIDVDLPKYISRDVRCLNSACYDGLDFRKTI